MGNEPTPGAVLWSIISFVGLLTGIGGLVWWYASQEKTVVHGPYPEKDPFLALAPTPSQRAVVKYLFVVVILWGVQILMGVITAHFGVEGKGFYGFPLDRYLPYAITRTWHLQLAIFWIATSWLAAGLYVGPAVSGHEPKYQRLGVNVLFGALILSLAARLPVNGLASSNASVICGSGLEVRAMNMLIWEDSGRFSCSSVSFYGLSLWLRLSSRHSFAKARTGRF